MQSYYTEGKSFFTEEVRFPVTSRCVRQSKMMWYIQWFAYWSNGSIFKVRQFIWQKRKNYTKGRTLDYNCLCSIFGNSTDNCKNSLKSDLSSRSIKIYIFGSSTPCKLNIIKLEKTIGCRSVKCQTSKPSKISLLDLFIDSKYWT